MKNAKHIILGVTGSIAAYKSADLIRRLAEQGMRISVVMTREAELFITPLALSSLAEGKVYSGDFKNDPEAWQMQHIRLAREADVVLIAPATANIIGKLACGIADDLLTCLVLGTKAKVLIAPAMNTEMYANIIVQGNCKKLKNLGFEFINPVKGKLACGTFGDGHLAEVEDIVKALLKNCK